MDLETAQQKLNEAIEVIESFGVGMQERLDEYKEYLGKKSRWVDENY